MDSKLVKCINGISILYEFGDLLWKRYKTGEISEGKFIQEFYKFLVNNTVGNAAGIFGGALGVTIALACGAAAGGWIVISAEIAGALALGLSARFIIGKIFDFIYGKQKAD